MKKFILLLVMAASLANCFAQYTPLPYFNGFENPADTVGMTFKKRQTSSGWYVGYAQHCMGQRSLYVSADTGATASYSTGGAGYVSVAYIPINLPVGTYTLAFDYCIGGNGSTTDMKVAWVPSSTTINATSTGSSYPNSIALNSITNSIGVACTFANSAWAHATATIYVTNTNGYNLCFAFRTNATSATPPGGCIDNIQIDTIHSATDCLYPVQNITSTSDAQYGVALSWQGNASTYEVVAAVSSDPTDHYSVSHIVSTTTDTFQFSELHEGRTFFYVRPVCGARTGTYSVINNVMVYDLAAHCINYTDFTDPNTRCTYGTYANPYATVGYIDNGPSQMSSRHTVHTDPNETDPRTNGALHTVPAGSLMSVRLGNWNTGAEAESITYTYNVPAGSSKILILKYAVIFEEPGHSEPPEFKLEVMNTNNQLLDPVCTRANFLCDGTLTNGWHSCQATGQSSGTTNFWYKEWSTIGVNLAQYAGYTVKIRLTSYDCNWSGHCGYGYFTLDCTDADFQSVSTATGKVITAPDGFNYQWTNGCTSQVVSTSQSLTVSNDDTCTYTCRCSYKEQSSCYFDIIAHTETTYPVADFSYSVSYAGCQTRIAFTNNSYIYKIENGRRVVMPNKTLSSQNWSISGRHINSTSVALNHPAVFVPTEGDTLTVTLTGFSGNESDDTTIVIHVPALHSTSSVTNGTVAKGEPYTFCNKTYTFISCDSVEVVDTAGTKSYIIANQKRIQVVETLYTRQGCDSIRILNLSSTIVHLTANANDTLMGTVTGGGCYNQGETVVLVASSKPDHHFVRWIDNNRDSIRSVVVNADVSYMAIFTSNSGATRHTVTVSANDPNMGTVYGGGTYDYGDFATVSAVANNHYRFVSWNTGDTADVLNFIVKGDTVLLATFEPMHYNLSVVANYDERGMVTGSGSYTYNDVATITATPSEGYQFTGWSNGITTPAAFITIVSDSVITALFEPIETSVENLLGVEFDVYSELHQIVIRDAETYAVYDSSGRLVASGTMTTNTKHVSVYIPGIYYVLINSKHVVKILVN